MENYFTGVKWHYIFNDYDVGVFKHPALKLFMRGLARLMQHFPKQAAPFDKSILLNLCYYYSSVLIF